MLVSPFPSEHLAVLPPRYEIATGYLLWHSLLGEFSATIRTTIAPGLHSSPISSLSPSHRILLNTLATYARSVFGLALGLFSSRWVLSALGEDDFGLFSVVGSIIVFITFLNGLMALSAARYFAYCMGEGKTGEVRKWFNSALSVHICFAFILILIGWPIGEYVVSHYISVPPDRLHAAHWVFRISLASAFINMISVPFVGMFTAKQRIAEMAVYGIGQTLSTFTLAYILTQIGSDRLIIYAFGMAGILSAIQLIIILRAVFVFNECQIVLADWFDWRRIKQMASYAVWNLIGSLGGTLRDQGSALLLNLHFGTKVNAAYGVASQVSSATNQLSAAMMGAFSPEITTSEGQGNRQRMLILAERANKFGTILVLLFAIPILIEMDYILTLWLKNPPQYTATFCRLSLITFLIDRLTSGYMLAVAAHGKIAGYQITIGGLWFLTLPIAWMLIKLGFPPASVGVAIISTMILGSLGRAIWMKHLLDVPINHWIMKTVIPCITVVLISSIIGVGFVIIMPSTFFRFFCVGSLTLVSALMVSWVFAVDADERFFFRNSIKRVFKKC